MGLMDVLKQYIDPASPTPGNAADHFDEVARQSSPQDIGSALSAAFRSDATPPFGQMMGSLFGRSDPQQQAGMLNQILGTLGSGGLAGLAGGAIGRILQGAGVTGSSITPDQASQLSPAQVSEIANHAHEQDGSIVDKLGDFYAQHPGLVKTLGAAALGIAMNHMANRR